MKVVPYQEKTASKKEQVAEMFNNISGKYDFLNHFLSFGVDILWRKKAIKLLKQKKPKSILDIATGTGDFAIEALKINPEYITGVDISEGMLEKAQQKINQKGLNEKIRFQLGDSEALPFSDATYDAITTGFGVRNFENLEKGLREMHRVLTANGAAIILEFSQPKKFPFKNIYNTYFKYILPFIGKIISKEPKAYTYLYKSVHSFPYGKDFAALLKQAKFRNITIYPLFFGIASIYFAEK